MGKYKEGRLLLELGDFAAAKEKFLIGVKEGDPKCAYGAMVTALHLNDDFRKAEQLLHCVIPLLETLAQNADEEACFILGRCNEKGVATQQNLPAAIAYYTQAASLGDADAMFNLGCIYMSQGAEEMAVNYFSRAARRGCIDAQKAIEHYRQTQKREG